MFSSSYVFGYDGDSGFSSTSAQANINRSVHSGASKTNMSMARNKASTGLTSSNEVPDLEAEERAEKAQKIGAS